MNYTYIVRCIDGTLYTGWTNDLELRVAAHNKGVASKYTRSRRPVDLIYYEEHDNKSDALCRERKIKSFSRQKKEQLIESFTLGDMRQQRTENS